MDNPLPDGALDGIHWKMVKPNDNVLSNKEARQFLKISQSQLDKLRKNKKIPSYLEKGCYFFLKADCVDWILKNQPDRLTEIKPK